jgi:hypothetical protein
MSAEHTKLTADTELEDKLAFGLSARQLVILGAGALAAYLAFVLASSLLARPLAAALATPIAIVGVALALGRRDGVGGDRFALFAARHLSQPRRCVLAPEGVPAPVRGLAALELPVRVVMRSGLIELDGGAFCLLLSAAGTSFQLRSAEEQAGIVAAFARFLNSLSESVQVVVRSAPLDLAARAGVLEDAAALLPHPALAAAARGHARFLLELSRGEEVRRREILLILSARARDRDAARATLARRAAEASDLLAGAGVTLRVLGGEQAVALLAHTLAPPGLSAGACLDGEVRAC